MKLYKFDSEVSEGDGAFGMFKQRSPNNRADLTVDQTGILNYSNAYNTSYM